MKSRHFMAAALLILAVAAFMRGLWLTADPPVRRSIGVVWHDEGAWVHNARNKALWDSWRTDSWNPVFVAPVFTALEYASFEAFGVGTWQARLVPVVSGIAAILCLMIGLHATAGPRAATIGGSLLAANYAFVMWNRAALMESTMTMWIVAAWMAWALASQGSAAGRLRYVGAAAAGLMVVAAWFTKAAAAFFVAAIAIEAFLLALLTWQGPYRRAHVVQIVFCVAGLVAGFVAIGVAFVLPYWTEYQFYNWQMSVTRKPEYTLRAFVDRATWIPIVQGIFSGMLVEVLGGLACLTTLALRWRTIRSAERLLVLWVLVGLIELIAHDSGNERRYVMFIPALVALASLALSAATPLTLPRASSGAVRLAAAALALPVFYLACGTLLRPWLLDTIEAGDLRVAVRLAAALAATAALLVAWQWVRLSRWLESRTVSTRAAAALVVVAIAWHVAQFADWARHRTTRNYDASVALGQLLPAGTLVQGKLANGMSLENRIRPLFVGNHFGNYDDRLQRDDARYILTYDLPRIGYESSDGSGLIQGILDHYPRWRIIASFDVDETRLQDRAVLIDKFPDDSPAHARD